MKHLKNFLFLAACFLAGVGIALGIMKFRAWRASLVTAAGPSYAPRMHGLYMALNQGSAAALASLPPLHASAVALYYPAMASAATGDLLKSVAAEARHLNLRTVLCPAGRFSGEDPYPADLTVIAAEAQAAGVDYLCVSWLDRDPDPGYWNAQTARVRNIFHGQLILAATPRILARTECADCADFLAAIGPITIPQRLPHAPDDVDLHTLRSEWGAALDTLESVALKEGKPLILLNAEVPVTVRAKLPLPGEPPPQPTPDPVLQRMSYEALLYETKGREPIEGVFLPMGPAGTDNTQLRQKIESLWSGPTHEVPATAASNPAPEDDPGNGN